MNNKNKQILLVDDSITMLSFLSKLFKAQYNVVDKDNAQSALEILNNGQLPDLIITDINMPHINGIEFVTKLKNNQMLNNIPIIVLTSNQDSSDKIKMLKLGVDDYIVKPFNAEELTIRAQNVIHRVYGKSTSLVN